MAALGARRPGWCEAPGLHAVGTRSSGGLPSRLGALGQAPVGVEVERKRLRARRRRCRCPWRRLRSQMQCRPAGRVGQGEGGLGHPSQEGNKHGRLSLGKLHQCPPDNLQFSRRAFLHQQFFWLGGATCPSLRTRGRHRAPTGGCSTGHGCHGRFALDTSRRFDLSFAMGSPLLGDTLITPGRRVWKQRESEPPGSRRMRPRRAIDVEDEGSFFQGLCMGPPHSTPWISSRDPFGSSDCCPLCRWVSGFLRVSSLFVACLQSCPPLGSSSHRWPKGERRCAARLELD